MLALNELDAAGYDGFYLRGRNRIEGEVCFLVECACEVCVEHVSLINQGGKQR